MTGITKVNVKEAPTVLKELIKKSSCPEEILKLRILYLLQIGKPIQEIAVILCLGRTTVYRWLKTYQSSGLKIYLGINTKNGRKPIIPESIMPCLKEAIILGKIENFEEANQWLIDKHQIATNYDVTRNFILKRLKNDPICSTFIKKKSIKVS